MKRLYAIDAKTGRAAGAKEPDYEEILKHVTEDMSISKIQRTFVLSFYDANIVYNKFRELDNG